MVMCHRTENFKDLRIVNSKISLDDADEMNIELVHEELHLDMYMFQHNKDEILESEDNMKST
jgi:hypothetical protein